MIKYFSYIHPDIFDKYVLRCDLNSLLETAQFNSAQTLLWQAYLVTDINSVGGAEHVINVG